MYYCESIKHAWQNSMQEDKTPVYENMIERNPYDISSDEDEDNTSPVLPSLLKKLKLLTMTKT